MPVLLTRQRPEAGSVAIKICGLSTQAQIQGACAAGARFVGFVFFDKSPRAVSFEQARELALEVPVGCAKVGLVVNPDDDFLDALCAQVPLDLLQLHGRESVERVVDIKARTGLPVMKAVGVSEAGDLPALDRYGVVADMLLVDAKAPKGADLPGGNGLSFDWRLIAGREWRRPWMLAGGLTPQNVAEARRLTGARLFDVSSGVESAPGVKDDTLMRDFVGAVGD